jgi:hypothetical protein
VSFLYFEIFTVSFLITFLSPEIATSINTLYYYYYHHRRRRRRRRRTLIPRWNFRKVLVFRNLHKNVSEAVKVMLCEEQE